MCVALDPAEKHRGTHPQWSSACSKFDHRHRSHGTKNGEEFSPLSRRRTASPGISGQEGNRHLQHRKNWPWPSGSDYQYGMIYYILNYSICQMISICILWHILQDKYPSSIYCCGENNGLPFLEEIGSDNKVVVWQQRNQHDRELTHLVIIFFFGRYPDQGHSTLHCLLSMDLIVPPDRFVCHSCGTKGSIISIRYDQFSRPSKEPEFHDRDIYVLLPLAKPTMM